MRPASTLLTPYAVVLYREAPRSWRDLGLVWDEALCGLDMVLLLDATLPEVRAAADYVRETFTRLGAVPFLAKLDATQGKRE